MMAGPRAAVGAVEKQAGNRYVLLPRALAKRSRAERDSKRGFQMDTRA